VFPSRGQSYSLVRPGQCGPPQDRGRLRRFLDSLQPSQRHTGQGSAIKRYQAGELPADAGTKAPMAARRGGLLAGHANCARVVKKKVQDRGKYATVRGCVNGNQGCGCVATAPVCLVSDATGPRSPPFDGSARPHKWLLYARLGSLHPSSTRCIARHFGRGNAFC
jgi:hypothetical protein